jgi:hypothetical protein
MGSADAKKSSPRPQIAARVGISHPNRENIVRPRKLKTRREDGE